MKTFNTCIRAMLTFALLGALPFPSSAEGFQAGRYESSRVQSFADQALMLSEGFFYRSRAQAPIGIIQAMRTYVRGINVRTSLYAASTLLVLGTGLSPHTLADQTPSQPFFQTPPTAKKAVAPPLNRVQQEDLRVIIENPQNWLYSDFLLPLVASENLDAANPSAKINYLIKVLKDSHENSLVRLSAARVLIVFASEGWPDASRLLYETTPLLPKNLRLAIVEEDQRLEPNATENLHTLHQNPDQYLSLLGTLQPESAELEAIRARHQFFVTYGPRSSSRGRNGKPFPAGRFVNELLAQTKDENALYSLAWMVFALATLESLIYVREYDLNVRNPYRHPAPWSSSWSSLRQVGKAFFGGVAAFSGIMALFNLAPLHQSSLGAFFSLTLVGETALSYYLWRTKIVRSDELNFRSDILSLPIGKHIYERGKASAWDPMAVGRFSRARVSISKRVIVTVFVSLAVLGLGYLWIRQLYDGYDVTSASSALAAALLSPLNRLSIKFRNVGTDGTKSLMSFATAA